jgi:N-acetylmuramoyl-L-alanine amidase
VRTRLRDGIRQAVIAAGLVICSAALGSAQAPGDVLPLVVIDAGHGGVDPGARGPGGTREKDVTLSVARILAEELRATGRYDVRLTRNADTLIALRDRPRMANRWRREGGMDGRPSIFLSIHANAHRDISTRGFETYFLSDAKTADARRVAEMENAAEQYEDASSAPADDLSFILTDLRQNLYVHESSSWAEMVQQRLRATHPGPNRGVKQAGFVVLDGAFMPAVLVELAFMSNAREERMLSERARQREFAEQLALAVSDFFHHHETLTAAANP